MAIRKRSEVVADEAKQREREILFESLGSRITNLRDVQIPRLRERAKQRNDQLLAIRACMKAAEKLPADVGVAGGKDLTHVITTALVEAERQLVRRVEEFNTEIGNATALLKRFEKEFAAEFPGESVAA